MMTKMGGPTNLLAREVVKLRKVGKNFPSVKNRGWRKGKNSSLWVERPRYRVFTGSKKKGQASW